MNKEEIIELDSIIELTDSLNPHASRGLSNDYESDVAYNSHTLQLSRQQESLATDEAVFDTLKAPRISSGASFMPPYSQNQDPVLDPILTQGYAQEENQNTDITEDIIELDSNTVIHPTSHIHSNTIHADSLHVAEVHINTLHASKAFHDAADMQNIQKEQEVEHQELMVPEVRAKDTLVEDTHIEEYQEEGGLEESTVQNTMPIAPLSSETDENIQEMLRDISTLKTSLASMQLRLAAQESCIARLESRLMASETKNHELESLCAAKETGIVHNAQLEQITASTAARVVREEIQALMSLIGKS